MLKEKLFFREYYKDFFVCCLIFVIKNIVGTCARTNVLKSYHTFILGNTSLSRPYLAPILR